MDKQAILAALLKGEMEVKDAVGRLSEKDLAVCSFNYSKELTKFSKSKVISIIRTSSKRNQKEEVLVLIYYRIYMCMETLVALGHPRYILGVAASLRSIFELYLDLITILKEKDGEMIEKYIAFGEIEMFNAANRKVEFYKNNFPERKKQYFLQEEYVNNPEREKSVLEKCKNLWEITKIAKCRDIQNWSKQSTKKRAKKLGPEYEAKYHEFYWQLSSLIHGSGLEMFEKWGKNQFESFFAFCHENAQELFVESTKIIAANLEIDKAWAHEGFYNKLDEIKKENMIRFLNYKLDELEKQKKN